ncbi:glycosyltransferase family 2 protein [Cellulomonas sp. URHE0023]|uniref:glycosyltransferase family 2 protein n=1 Tax=Cellulomonas sp. URHE0023 TaxID=1380354 RepID=UPI000689E594|nr:glycosyltransferase family 2 protein [Cellulomonas sp. URHE0023]
MTSAQRTLSIIIPAYNEHEGAAEIVSFYREIRASVPDLEFELVVVDDGSTDGTSDALLELLGPEDRAKVIVFSRNFGSHAAISAGFAHCTGDAALTLSADRQEPLSAVFSFVEQWRDGADLVWGLRSVRSSKGGSNEFFARTFSSTFHAISTVPTYPREGPSHILVSRRVIDVLNAMPEQNRNVLAMAAWTGFDQRRVYFEQLPRPYGKSKWTSAKKVKLVTDSIVEFSAVPLTWIVLAGVVMAGLGLGALVVALVMALTGAQGTGLMLVGVVLGAVGVQVTALGVLGQYVSRAGDDARRRPLYVVQDIH